MRALERSILAGLAVVLAGCSPSSMMERLPTEMGGLPAGAPTAPAAPSKYPAVHDMPPPRPDQPLTDEQQDKLEKDLQAARDRLDSQKQADEPADNKAAAKTKKQAKTVKKPDTAGAAKNP